MYLGKVKLDNWQKLLKFLDTYWLEKIASHSYYFCWFNFGEFLSKELKGCQKQVVPFLPSAFSLDKTWGQKCKCWLSSNGGSALTGWKLFALLKGEHNFLILRFTVSIDWREEIAALLLLVVCEEQTGREAPQLFTLCFFHHTPTKLLFPLVTSTQNLAICP